ncbi:MAG: VCBS repeat-containing protein [Acidobacteria bacterium]|nr:VCBS repeat-containing protein [Acidobacteriota bacterium]
MTGRLAVCLILGVLAVDARWRLPNRCCRLRVVVEAGAMGNVPVTVPVELGQRDPNSIAVMGERGLVASRISESLERGEAGRVWWLVERPGRHEYFIYFNRRGGKPAPLTEAREAIGNGDNFFYNRPGGFDPLGVGMKNDQPIAVDWDGDGRTDLLQRNLYSAAYGEPWWGLYFWRNIGTNREPRFDRSVRLKVDGKVIEDYYASFQLTDWNHDGRLDILCGVGGGRDRNTLKVYFNTGERDALGLPVLKTGPRVEWHGGGDLTYGMRLADPDSSGVPQLFTLRLKVQYFPTQEMDATWYRHVLNGGDFGPPQALELAGKTVYGEWPTDFIDVNGDGRPDLVGATRGLETEPLRSCVVAWENTGTGRTPAFPNPPKCIIDTTPEGFAIPVAADSAAFHGLLVSYMGAWLRYFERGPAGFETRGPLLARGLPCSSGGYSSVEVADWEGDGDLDFIVGNEVGFVQLIENVSRNGKTQFAAARGIPLTNGREMYAARWQFIRDADPERPLGQSKPTYADWDGDGDLDMLVGNNSNRIAYFENVGTRKAPRFAPHRALTHDGGEHFSFRARPAVVDWNGDGLADVVTGWTGVRDRNDNPWITVSLYLRYRAADGTLHLHQPEPLRLEDGEALRTPIPYQHGFEVADWDGDGDFDLLANQDKVLVLYRNMGSNARPRFRRELLRYFGQPIQVGLHETSAKAVDWDHDGKPDLITGGESGWIYYFRRATLESAAPPGFETGVIETRK